MMPTWNSTITIYNCHKGGGAGGKDVWHRAVLSDCFVRCALKKTMDGSTERTNREFTIRIPPDDGYVKATVWVALPNKTGRFTLTQNDIIVTEFVTDVIGDGAGQLTATALMAKYPDTVCRIREFADNSGHIPGHYRVVGK